jgi:GNAT superfamily N-acetyltransferase
MQPRQQYSAPDGWRVRDAVPQDVPELDRMIHELAEYEREPDAVLATPADLQHALFRPGATVHAFVAEPDGGTPGTDGHLAGMAIWFPTYSTWTGRHGIWLEDLFVRPQLRGSGLGRALLTALARRCVADGGARLEWNVLDWNEPALRFYRSLGASGLQEWTVHRLDGDALRELAEGSGPAAPPAGPQA